MFMKKFAALAGALPLIPPFGWKHKISSLWANPSQRGDFFIRVLKLCENALI
jgi:hypothetical protein